MLLHSRLLSNQAINETLLDVLCGKFVFDKSAEIGAAVFDILAAARIGYISSAEVVQRQISVRKIRGRDCCRSTQRGAFKWIIESCLIEC